MSAGFDRDAVAAALRPGDIATRYGWRTTRSGRWLRSVTCPACGGGESEAFAIGDRGFRCHRCERRGDLLSLVALAEGLDPRRDFERVLAAAAGIAGVPPREREQSAAELAELSWGRERRRRELERQAVKEDHERVEKAADTARSIWGGLQRRSRPGEAYLHERGLGALLGRDDVVRFDERGTVRLPLYGTDGQLINVPGRYLPGREPKKGRRILNVTGCPTKGSFGHPDDLLHYEGPVVVCEGIFDYLSAIALWPGRACYGAHGASNLPHVAGMVAGRIADRIVYLVPHHDPAGIRAAKAARAVLLKAGIGRHRIRIYDTSEAGDLYDWLLADKAEGAES